jgi:hypothetical protein
MHMLFSARDRIVCISTFSASLEDVLSEDDDSLVTAIIRVMKIRNPEVYEAFERWMKSGS